MTSHRFSGLTARHERRALTLATGVLVCGLVAVPGRAAEDAKPDEDALAPPPPEPKAGDQEPAPFLQRPAERRALRGVVVGLDAGLVQRVTRDAYVDFAGPRLGGTVLLSLVAPGGTPSFGKLWLGMRLGASAEWQERHEGAAIRRAGPTLEPAALEGLHLGVRFEPGYQPTERFRAFAVLGVAWTRFQTSSYLGTADRTVRTGAVVEFPLGVGLGFELLPNWLEVGFSTTIAPVTSNEGSLFEPAQVVGDGGVLSTVAPILGFGPTFSATLSLGVVL